MPCLCIFQVVFLSPDAREPLLHIDPDTVYAIGGVVDRSVRKGMTLGFASAQGIATRRLPVSSNTMAEPNRRKMPIRAMLCHTCRLDRGPIPGLVGRSVRLTAPEGCVSGQGRETTDFFLAPGH